MIEPNIVFYDRLPSTNRVAATAAREGCDAFFTVAAEIQTEGRGRLTRTFFSPRGGSYFSIVLHPRFPMAEYGRLTPFAAVALWRAIQKTTGREAEIKWVNDLLLDGKKIAGILTESGLDANGVPFAVVGIGVNTGNEPFPPELASIATHLPDVDSKTLIRAAVTEFYSYEEELRTGMWLSQYRAHCAVLGQSVRISAPWKEPFCAKALDILPNGALLVQREGGEREALSVGEISLRTAQIL